MTTETTNALSIGSGSDWQSVNGAWLDGKAEALMVPEPPRRSGGPNLVDADAAGRAAGRRPMAAVPSAHYAASAG